MTEEQIEDAVLAGKLCEIPRNLSEDKENV